MVLEYIEEDLYVVQKYVELLQKFALVKFTGNTENGFVEYLTDEAGNTFARVIIELVDDGEKLGETSLVFSPFEKNKRAEILAAANRQRLRCIRGGKA